MDPQTALKAASEKVSAFKSVTVDMTTKAPAGTAGVGGAAATKGKLGWDPLSMDMVVKTGQAEAGMPAELPMKWDGGVMYMDMGAEGAAELDGKRWMKIDLAAAAKAGGAGDAMKQFDQLMGSFNQGPAMQIDMLRAAEGVKYVGTEKIGGVEAKHFRGTVAGDALLDTEGALKGLDAETRKQLRDSYEKSGVKSQDTDLWIGADDLLVRADSKAVTKDGALTTKTLYSDFTGVLKVTPPPAGQTMDLMKMLQGIGDLTKDGGPSDADMKELEDALGDM
ncbi:PE-PGRS family protein [Streptomyces sp. SPB074]|nr:PE-PGRS family protein [Streptomyces sp. SPB074]